MNNRLLIVCSAAVAVMLTGSCSEKEQEFQLSEPAVMAIQDADKISVVELTEALPAATISIRAVAESISGNTLTIDFTTDLSLVDAYNSANGTDYAALPADAFQMTTPSVIMPRYNTVSSTAEITVDGIVIPENGTYLLPIVFDKIEGDDTAGISEENGVRYVEVVRNLPEGVKQKVYTLSEVPGLTGDLHAVYQLPDGNLVVATKSGEPNHGIVLLDPVSGSTEVLVDSYPGSHPYSVAFSPDYSTMYIAYKAKGEVGIYDMTSGSAAPYQIILSGFSTQVLDVDCDSEGNVYVLERDNAIYRYPADNITPEGQEVYVDCAGDRIFCMEFDKDENMFVFTRDKGFCMVPSGGGELTHVFGAYGGDTESGPAENAAFSGIWDFAIDGNGNIWIADTDSNGKLKLVTKGENDDYSDAVLSTLFGGEGQEDIALPRDVYVNEEGTEAYFTNNESGASVYKVTVTEK